MNLRDQLILTVVDKFFIAIILLVAGYFLNQFLERFKTREAVRVEVAKQRVNKISETWSAVYDWEGYTKNLMGDIGDTYERLRSDPTQLELRIKELWKSRMPVATEKGRTAQSLIEKNRFWLGESLYNQFCSYYDSLNAYLAAVYRNDVKALTDIDAALERSKVNITNTFDDL